VTAQVRFDPEAVAELRAARDWYEEASVGLGDDLVDEVLRAIDRVIRWPDIAPRLTPRGVSVEVRRAPLTRFLFGIVYFVSEGTLWIVAVAHGRRRPGYWRNRVTRARWLLRDHRHGLSQRLVRLRQWVTSPEM
jgi:hypothetical protein